MYHIEIRGQLFRIECEEHGESYAGWRKFDNIPEKLRGPLATVMAATSGDDHGKLDHIGEKISPFEFLIY